MITVNLLHADSWCQPCKMFKPIFESVSQDTKYSSLKFNIIDIETDEGFKLCETHHVKSVPTTLILNDDNEELYKIIGCASKNEVTYVLDSILDKTNK